MLPKAVVAAVIAVLSMGCRTPTQVTVELATDIPCGDMPDTTVQVGRIGPDLEGRPASIATRTCGSDGHIGSFVVVPSGEPNDEFAIKVILGHAGRTAAGCRSDETGSGARLPGCIFARRGLHYLPHTELTLPVTLRGDCDGIVCRDLATTCVHGSCVTAIIPDPGTCLGAGCGDNGLKPIDGGDILPDGGMSDGEVPDGGTSNDGPSGTDAFDGTAADADTGTPPPDACGSGCTPPSCAIPLTCGTAGDSCCESPLVTGDDFLRQNEQGYPAHVSSFRLDKYETTVGRFRVFVDAMTTSMWTPPAGSGKHVHVPRGGLYSVNDLAVETGWDPAWNAKLAHTVDDWNSGDYLDCINTTWTPTPGGNEHRPIVCVDWYQAYAFCIWDGGFLPSYAEWNFAAAGGREQRSYPWGNTPPDMTRAQYCDTNCGSLINVGSKAPGNGRYGQSDLAGNAWEWVLDAPPSVTGDLCNDCVIFDQRNTSRIILGGGYDSAASSLLTTAVTDDLVEHRDYGDSFRCARPP